MEFIKTEGLSELEDAVAGALNSAFKENLKVLWLVPGGSNIKAAVNIMKRLPAKDTHRLAIMLTDERYGPVGHPDSNYQQFKEAGFMEGEASFIQTLSNSSLEETVLYFGKVAEKLFEEAGAVIGFFGMGADGHTAGILPETPAAGSADWVVGYEAGQFTRITLTPYALSHLKVAFVGAFGKEKRSALERLKNEMLPVRTQPAQIFRHIESARIYNDQIGE